MHYSERMSATDTFARTAAPPRLLGWPRVRVALIASAVIGLILRLTSVMPTVVVVGRTMVVGVSAMLAFGLFERWPARLPRWLARWVLQLLGVVVSVPLAALFAYWLTTGGQPHFATEPARVQGYFALIFTGILFAPWIAVGALVRQRDTFARDT